MSILNPKEWNQIHLPKTVQADAEPKGGNAAATPSTPSTPSTSPAVLLGAASHLKTFC